MIARTLKYKTFNLHVIAECRPKPFIDIPLYHHFYSGNKLYYKCERHGKEIAIEEVSRNEVLFDSMSQVYLVKGVFRN